MELTNLFGAEKVAKYDTCRCGSEFTLTYRDVPENRTTHIALRCVASKALSTASIEDSFIRMNSIGKVRARMNEITELLSDEVGLRCTLGHSKKQAAWRDTKPAVKESKAEEQAKKKPKNWGKPADKKKVAAGLDSLWDEKGEESVQHKQRSR